jgi:hypothetical protein
LGTGSVPCNGEFVSLGDFRTILNARDIDSGAFTRDLAFRFAFVYGCISNFNFSDSRICKFQVGGG